MEKLATPLYAPLALALPEPPVEPRAPAGFAFVTTNGSEPVTSASERVYARTLNG